MDKVENKSTATVLRDVGDDNQNVKERTLRRPRALLLPPEAKSAEVEGGSKSAGWTNIQWKNIRVGDVVRLSRDETVPADIVLLYAHGDNGVAYVETMALDGETNLKSKQALSVFKDCDSISGIQACSAEFVIEDPNPNLYSFEGRVAVGDKVFPLTLNQVIYRGSVLRNTQFAIGLVANTGEECKVRASKGVPSCQPNLVYADSGERKPPLEGKEASPREARESSRVGSYRVRRYALGRLFDGLPALAAVDRISLVVFAPRAR